MNKTERWIHRIPAMMSDEEKLAIYKLAGTIKNSDILEIGSWTGGSTILLAKGVKNGQIYAIDPHNNKWQDRKLFEEFDVKDNIFDVFTKMLKIWC
jgi:predicted O-methyltransferase YrrM